MTEKYIIVNNKGEKIVGTLCHLVGVVDSNGDYIGNYLCKSEEELLGTLVKAGNTVKIVLE